MQGVTLKARPEHKKFREELQLFLTTKTTAGTGNRITRVSVETQSSESHSWRFYGAYQLFQNVLVNGG